MKDVHVRRRCVFWSDTWDCVATCFFIDTAHNVIEYVETIWKILKPGGVWINLGESALVKGEFFFLHIEPHNKIRAWCHKSRF